MSRTVDERVVRMDFDNKKFEQGVAESTATLEKLEKTIQSLGKNSSALDKLERSLSNISLKGLEGAVDKVGRSIANLSFAGIESSAQKLANALTIPGRVVANLKQEVANFVTSGIHSIDQMITKVTELANTGGMNRALNIESAKFQLGGLGVEWDKITGDINYAVAGTAYGLDAAAKAASQLVASGVEFGEAFGATGNSPMAKALRGISGVAAMTNSTYEGISRIFTQVAGNGRLMGNDLTQLASRGLNVAATLGDALGKTEQEIREMVSKGQISFKMFSEAMDEAFGEHATKANETYTGSLSNVKAALSRLGASFHEARLENMKNIFNDLIPVINQFHNNLKPAIKIFNEFQRIVIDSARVFLQSRFLEDGIKNFTKQIYRFVRQVFYYRRSIEQSFQYFIATLINVGKAVGSFITPITDAFGIFNVRSFVSGILSLSKSLYSLSAVLIGNGEAANYIRTLASNLGRILVGIVSNIRSLAIAISPAIGLAVQLAYNVAYAFELLLFEINQLVGKSIPGFASLVASTVRKIQLNSSKIHKTLLNLKTTFVNLAKAVVSIVGPILRAFSNIEDIRFNGLFTDIERLSGALANLSASFILSEESGRKLTSIVSGGIKVVQILIEAIKGIVYVVSPIGKLVQATLQGIFTFAALTAEKFNSVFQVGDATDALTGLRSVVESIVNAFIYLGQGVPEAMADVVSICMQFVQGIVGIFDLLLSAVFGEAYDKKIDNVTKSVKGLNKEVKGSPIAAVLKLIAGALGLVGAAIEKINFKGIIDKIKDALDWVKDKLDGLVQLLSGGKINSVGELFGGIAAALHDLAFGSSEAAEGIHELNEAAGETQGILGGFVGFFVGMKDALAGFIDKTVGSNEELANFGDSATSAFDAIKKIPKTIKDANFDSFKGNMTKVTGLVGDMAKSLYDSMGAPDPGSIIGLGMGFGGTKALLSMSNMMDSFGKAAENVTGVGDKLAKAMGSIADGFKESMKANAKAAHIKSLALLLGVLVGSLIALAVAEKYYDFTDAIAHMTEVIVLVGGLLILIEKYSTAANPATIAALSGMAVSLGLAGLALSFALTNLMTIDWESMKFDQWMGGIGSLTGIVILLGGLVIALSKWMGSGVGIGGAVGTVLTMVGIIGALTLLVGVMKELTSENIESITQAFWPIVGLLAAVGAVAAVVGHFGKNAGIASIGKGVKYAGLGLAILAFALSLIPIVAALGILAKMDYADYENGLIRLAGIFAIMSGVILATKVAGAYAARAGAAILAMSAAVVLIGVALGLISAVAERYGTPAEGEKFSSLDKAFASIIVFLAAFAGLMHVSKFAGDAANKLAATFVAIGAAMLLISFAMTVVSTIDKDKYDQLTVMFTGMLAFFAIMLRASEYASNVDVKPIAALIVAVVAMAGSIAGLAFLIEAVGSDTVWSAAGVMAAGLLGMAVAMWGVSKLTQKLDLTSVVGFILAIGTVTGAILLISNFGGGWEQIIASAVGLGVAMVALGGALKLTDMVVSGINVANMAAFSIAILAMSAGLTILSGLGGSVGQILAAAAAISGTMVVLALVSKLASGSLAGAAAIVILSGAVLMLAVAFEKLATIDINNLIPPLVALGIALAALIAVTALLGAVWPVFLIGAGVLAALGVALLIVTSAIAKGVEAFGNMIVYIDALGDTIYNLGQRAPSLVASVASIFYGISAAFSEAMAGMLSGIPIIGEKLASYFEDAAGKATEKMNDAMQAASDAENGYKPIKKIAEGIEQGNKEVEAASANTGENLISGITSKLGDLKAAGTGLIGGSDGLLGGVTESMPQVIEAGENGMIDFVGALDKGAEANVSGQNTYAGFEAAVDPKQFANLGSLDGSAYIQAFNSALTIQSPSKEMQASGKFTLQGFMKGNSVSDYSKRGSESASAFLTAFRDTLGIHSPSLEAEDDGEYFGEGYSNGLESSMDSHVRAAANKMADATLEPFQNVLMEKRSDYAGKKVTENVAKGVGDKEANQKVEEAAETTGKKVTQATEKQVNEKKGKEAAKKYIIGISKGIDEYTYMAIQAANRLLTSTENVLSRLDVGQETFGYFVSHIQEYVKANEELQDATEGSRWMLANFVHENYRLTDGYKEHIEKIDEYRREIQLLSSDTEHNYERLKECFDGIAEEAQQMAKDAAAAFKDLRNTMISSMKDMLSISNFKIDPGFTLFTSTEKLKQEIFHVGDAFGSLQIQTKKSLNSTLKTLENFSQKALHTLTSDFAKISSVTKKTVESMHKSISAFSSFAQKETKSIASDLNIFSNYDTSYNEKWETGPKSFISHIEDELKKAEERVANFRKLQQRNISKDALEAIREMGSSGDEIVKQLIEASDADIEKFNRYYAKSTELAAGEIETPTEALIRSFEETIAKARKKEEDLATLASRGLSDVMIEELKGLGDEGEKIIQAFVEANDDEFERLKTLYSQQNEMKAESTESTLDAFVRGMREDLEKAEKREADYHKAYMNGFSTEMLDEIVAMGEEGDEILDQLANHLSAMDPKAQEIYDLYNKKQTFKEVEDPTVAIMRSLQEQIDKGNAKIENFAKLRALGIEETYLDQLKDMGDEAEPIITAMLGWTAEQVDQFNEKHKIVLDLAKEETESSLDAFVRMLDEKVNAVTRRMANEQKLVDLGVEQRLIDYIKSMGEEGDKILEELANADEITRGNVIRHYLSAVNLEDMLNEKAGDNVQGWLDENTETINKQITLSEKVLELKKMGLSQQFIDYLKENSDDFETAVDALLKGGQNAVDQAMVIYNNLLIYQSGIMKKGLDDAYQAVKDWGDSLAILANRGVNEQFLLELAKLGPGAQGTIQTLLAMTDPELKNFTDNWAGHMGTVNSIADNTITAFAAKAVTGADGFVAGLNAVPQKFAEAGVEANYLAMINGLGLALNPAAYKVGFEATGQAVQGILDKLEAAKEAGSKVGGAATSGAKGSGGSGLSGLKPAAVNAGQEVADGLESKEKEVRKAALGTAEAIREKIDFHRWEKGMQPKYMGQAIDDGLAEGMDDNAETVENSTQSLVDKLKGIITNDGKGFGINSPSKYMQEVGGYLCDGLSKGIDGGESTVTGSMNSLVGWVTGAIDEFDPLGSFKTIAGNMASGIITGLKENEGATGLASHNLVSNAKKEAKNVADTFTQIGGWMCSGLIKGLDTNVNAVINAAKRVAKAAFDAAKNLLDIQSPSKKFAELGRYSAEGFAVGMENGTGDVVDSVEAMSNAALNNMRDTIARINSSISSELQDPVIRPTIDMSNVNRFARQVSGIFGDAQMSARLSAEGQATDQNAGNTNVTYNQYNYSPKALSRTEIYRQTNNQLKSVRTALGRA